MSDEQATPEHGRGAIDKLAADAPLPHSVGSTPPGSPRIDHRGSRISGHTENDTIQMGSV